MIFSLLLCFVLFLSGIYATDVVMKKNLLLSNQNYKLPFSAIGQALEDKGMNSAGKIAGRFVDKAEDFISDIKDVLFHIFDRAD